MHMLLKLAGLWSPAVPNRGEDLAAARRRNVAELHELLAAMLLSRPSTGLLSKTGGPGSPTRGVLLRVAGRRPAGCQKACLSFVERHPA